MSKAPQRLNESPGKESVEGSNLNIQPEPIQEESKQAEIQARMKGYLEMTISRRNKLIDGEFLRQSRMLSEAKKSKMSRSKSRNSESKSNSPKKEKKKKDGKSTKSKSPTKKSTKKKAPKSISPKKQTKMKKDPSLPQFSNSSEKVPHSRSVMKTNNSMMDKLIS